MVLRTEYFKHLLVNTPLEPVALKLRTTAQKLSNDKDPKWQELRDEEGFIDQVLPRIVDKNSNCLDVGGHLGATTSKLTRLAPQGTHAVVEPLPYKADWLRKKFPRVTVHQVAISDKPGTAEFFYQPHSSGFSGLNVHGSADTAQKLTVKCETLDNLWPRDTPLTFMKIDIEGGELPALRGAEKLITHWKPILLFECTESGTEAFGYKASELYDLLTRTYGYNVYKVRAYVENAAPLDLAAFNKAIVFPAQAFNFIAAPAKP